MVGDVVMGGLAEDEHTPSKKNTMSGNDYRTALVTGATSGLGFEAAAQLPERGYGRVIITGRDLDRAEAARQQLVEQTDRDVFEVVVVDFNLPDSVQAAALDLAAREVTIDFLLLNAGVVSGQGLVVTEAGVEITFASSLVGHHQLTAELLDQGRLSDSTRIVIAGSEAARGDVPTFSVTDLPTLANKHYVANLEAAAVALIRGSAPGRYKSGNTSPVSMVLRPGPAPILVS